MDFVIAVKSEPNRKARVTATNRVTLLLSSSSEVTDTSILHRDAVYNSKLQGTCFSCSKLNANPPADVCVTPDGGGGGGGGGSCLNYDDPCFCLTCPPPPDDRECSCGTGGYPAPNTPGLGSGYWAGIQANTHYSNVPNGGWVVAVACGSSEVIGAFPVTGNNFGYGRGTVMGLPAMIYPAGALYGAGYRPVNETSFPILALVPADGNYLITIGAFGNRATGSTLPGCPSESSNEQYYCTDDNTTVYEGIPRACIAKYNGDNDSPCPVFANYVAFAEGIEDNTPYSMNMAGVSGFPFGSDPGPGAILFQDDNSNQYCGTVDLVPKPSDAAGGSCGGTIFPDTPISFSDDCISCDQKVPCEYVANLTNGNIDIDHGGFNAAGSSGFQSIGPAFPPESDGTGGFKNTEYWENYWGWTPTIQSYIPLSDPDNPISVIIPPITALEDNCSCSTGESNNSSIVIIEPFACCVEFGTDIAPPVVSQHIIKRSMSPGLSGCGVSCSPPCVNPNCSCVGTTDAIGPVGIYGYAPCRLCECTEEGKNGTAIEFESQPTSIWWASGITQHNQVVYSSQTTLEAPNCINTCSSVMSNKGNYCGSPCGKLFRSVTTVVNGATTKIIEVDLDNFKLCTGFDNPQEMLDDPCGLSKFLPSEFHDEVLTYQPTLVDPASNPYSLANYIATNATATSLGSLLGDETNPDFYLNHSTGPFGIAYASGINDPETNDRDCYAPNVFSFIVCAIPKLKHVQAFNCESECETVEKVFFDEVRNEMCFDQVTNELIGSDQEAVQDPCGCCGKNLIENELSCGGGDCPSCCGNGGCVTGDCEPAGSVNINPNNCTPGGGTGYDEC